MGRGGRCGVEIGTAGVGAVCPPSPPNGVFPLELRWRKLRSEVGNGQKTDFWTDHWIEGKLLCDEFPRIFKLAKVKKAKVCDYYYKIGNTVLWEWEWEINPSSQEEWGEIGILMELLAKVHRINRIDGKSVLHNMRPIDIDIIDGCSSSILIVLILVVSTVV
ncbi:hypothetical protein R6Q59_002016 [Mikania micrantha]